MVGPLEAGNGKGQILSYILQKEHSPTNTLALGLLSFIWNYVRISLHIV